MINLIEFLTSQGHGSINMLADYMNLPHGTLHSHIWRIKQGSPPGTRNRIRITNGINKAFSREYKPEEIDFTYKKI